MPRKLFDDDGTEFEVPTDEELKGLKEIAEKFKGQEQEFVKLQTELEDYKSNPVEKNWKSARKTIDNLKNALKEQGKEVNINEETGEITLKTDNNLSKEEIIELQRKTTREEIVNAEKRRMFGKYDEEKRKVVEHYLEKLTAGEEVNLDNIGTFFSNAERLAGITPAPSKPTLNGQPPVFQDPNAKGFGDTEEGKAIANEIFGEQSYAKSDKK